MRLLCSAYANRRSPRDEEAVGGNQRVRFKPRSALALTAMCCYRVAVSELLEIGRQNRTILKANESFLVHAGDRHNLPICCPKIGVMAIGGDQKPVAASNLEQTPFIHRKALCLPGGDRPQFAALIADYQSLILDLRNLDGFILRNSLDCPVKPRNWPGRKLRRSLFCAVVQFRGTSLRMKRSTKVATTLALMPGNPVPALFPDKNRPSGRPAWASRRTLGPREEFKQAATSGGLRNSAGGRGSRGPYSLSPRMYFPWARAEGLLSQCSDAAPTQPESFQRKGGPCDQGSS
jgi:hypothetical protein